MSEKVLPFEEEWGFAEWCQWEIGRDHRFYRTCNNNYLCEIRIAYEGFRRTGDTLDEAARACAALCCEHLKIPLPFRPLPDLSTVESCLQVITDVGTIALHKARTDRCPIQFWAFARTDYVSFGECGKPWTLEDLQTCAKYALKIPVRKDEDINE